MPSKAVLSCWHCWFWVVRVIVTPQKGFKLFYFASCLGLTQRSVTFWLWHPKAGGLWSNQALPHSFHSLRWLIPSPCWEQRFKLSPLQRGVNHSEMRGLSLSMIKPGLKQWIQNESDLGASLRAVNSAPAYSALQSTPTDPIVPARIQFNLYLRPFSDHLLSDLYSASTENVVQFFWRREENPSFPELSWAFPDFKTLFH